MPRLGLRLLGCCLGVAGFFGATTAATAEGWGTVSGTVTYAGDPPTRPELKVDKDKADCLKNGPLLSEDVVVNPKNKGVRWAFVWLVDANDPLKKLPINPDLEKLAEKEVVVDQPCCQFEPHVIGLRVGQVLVTKNSSKIPHNVNVVSGLKGPNMNPIIPPGGKVEVKGWTQQSAPTSISCSIHPWMKGYVRAFNHPYFAVTDEDGKYSIKKAPAGDYRIVVWQESKGYLNADGKKGAKVTIKDGGDTVENFELKP